jgi:hypothetical protein
LAPYYSSLKGPFHEISYTCFFVRRLLLGFSKPKSVFNFEWAEIFEF